ncbi:uncharacterized protein LOC144315407 [Canis aureus]
MRFLKPSSVWRQPCPWLSCVLGVPALRSACLCSACRAAWLPLCASTQRLHLLPDNLYLQTQARGESHHPCWALSPAFLFHCSSTVQLRTEALRRRSLSEHHVSTRLRSVSLGSTCPASHQPPCQPSCHCKSLIAHEAVTRNDFAPSLVKIYAICKAAPSAALCFVYKAV